MSSAGDHERSCVPHGSFLTVVEASRRYALPVDLVGAVGRVEKVTRIPLCPRHVVGLTSVNGATRILLSPSLGSDHRSADALAEGRVIALRGEGNEFALVVDHIGDVFRARPEDIFCTADPALKSGYHAGDRVWRGSEFLPIFVIPAFGSADPIRAETNHSRNELSRSRL